MAKLLFQVQEKTLKTIHQTFEGIKEAFLGVKNGEFLPTAKLIARSIGNEGTKDFWDDASAMVVSGRQPGWVSMAG